jgi:cellulase
MAFKLSLLSVTVSLLLAGLPLAQAAEDHPLLPTWKCTSSGGCVQQNTSVVLDQDSKYAKGAAGSRTASDYAAMGVTTSGNAVTLYHYVRNGGSLTPASPRIYLLGADGKYVLMNLLNNQELSVDVDLSSLPCGENGAFYLSEMAADGRGDAGGGTGYCDAQCQGYCCNEMDILEANSMATAMTPHPCKGDNCDKAGCAYNPYASGQRNFWGPGKTVDTGKPFTVVTQFAASGGRLSQITRKYIQNGREIGGGGTISNCGSEGSTGGLAGMGQALGRGSKSLSPSLSTGCSTNWISFADSLTLFVVVLAMSIWNDAAQQMAWLDSGGNGPCTSGQGSPSNIQSQHPDTHVVFSNIRWGDIGSTTRK